MRHLNKHNIFVKKTVAASAVIFAALVFFSVFMVKTWPQRTYYKIDKLIENQEYIQAEELIKEYEAKENTRLTELSNLCSYYIAIEEIAKANTQEARYRLNNLTEYKDTAQLILECSYVDAKQLMQDEKYQDAYLIYAMLSDYKDSKNMMQEAKYQTANQYYNQGQLANALETYLSLRDYKDSESKSTQAAIKITGADTIEEANKILEGVNLLEIQKIAQLTAARNNLHDGVLAVGAHHTVGLMADGSVKAVGLNDTGQCQVDEWSDIIAVDAGAYHTVALKSDGKVMAAGRNDEGQCDVSSWQNVVKIAAGAYSTYGLLEDGTIVSTGYNSSSHTIQNINNAVYINAGAYAAGCITKEGIVYFSHPSLILHETGPISVDVSTGYAVILMPDGQVVSTLKDDLGWEDIISISAGSNMILAIDIDGKILAHFFDSRDEINLSEYDHIVDAAAGGSHFALLIDDGSVECFGSNEYGECDVEDWQLIINDN